MRCESEVTSAERGLGIPPRFLEMNLTEPDIESQPFTIRSEELIGTFKCAFDRTNCGPTSEWFVEAGLPNEGHCRWIK